MKSSVCPLTISPTTTTASRVIPNFSSLQSSREGGCSCSCGGNQDDNDGGYGWKRSRSCATGTKPPRNLRKRDGNEIFYILLILASSIVLISAQSGPFSDIQVSLVARRIELRSIVESGAAIRFILNGTHNELILSKAHFIL